MNDFTTNAATQEQAAIDDVSADATRAQPRAIEDDAGVVNGDSNKAAIDGTDLRYIPLNKLVASPLNVRKSGGQDIDELAMLILSQGLLANLVVMPHVTKKNKPTNKFEVVAGGRRRRALARLAELGKIAADEKVPCKLTTKEKALSASVAENSAREPMSKPDTVQAFAAMAASGATPEDISVSFGITPLTVMRRLKLANVSPRLFELYRAEEITTEQMMALAIVDDHETQERVWESTARYERHPSTLRRLLLGREIEAARDPEALYVGVKAYEEAGGRLVRDLFVEDENAGYIGDAELLHRLACEMLQAEADKLSAEGWKWTEARTKFDYSERNQFAMAAMTLRAPTVQEASKLAALGKKQREAEDSLEEMYECQDDEDYDHKKADAFENVADTARVGIERLHAAMRQYAPEVLAVAGAVVTIDHSGSVAIHRGLIRPEDRVEAKKAIAKVSGGGGNGSQENDESDSKKPLISEPLQRKLTAHRTKALQVRLADNPHVALAAIVHVLLQQVVEVGYVRSALSIRGSGCSGVLEQAASDMKGSKADIELTGYVDNWRERLPGDSDKLLPWLIGQGQKTLLELLALCVALSTDTVTTRDQEHPGDALASAVGLDMADYWTASGVSYFAQVSKAQIAEAVTEAVSAEEGAALLKLKKGEAVVKAEALMAGTRWLPSELRPR